MGDCEEESDEFYCVKFNFLSFPHVLLFFQLKFSILLKTCSLAGFFSAE